MSRRAAEFPPRPPAGELGDPRRALGRLGEQLAAAHLGALGFNVLARNVRSRHGEIDLIAFDGRTLAFVEVKTRRAGARGTHAGTDGGPLSGLGGRQRARLRRLAAVWLRESASERPYALTIRFDAIGVTVDRSGAPLAIEHVEAAW